MWTSREGWLTAVSTWAHTSGFAACCEAARVSLSSATVLAVARVMAAHADHASGRHCAVTRATIAEQIGCDTQTITRVWRLLRAAGWVVEASRGHGSPTTVAAGRRPSVYHLVPHRSRVQPVDNVYLPPKAGFCSLTPVEMYSPKARERAEKMPITPKRRRCRLGEPAPRPLSVQRLAAELVRDCHGLHRGHIGAICDAITATGIDPAVWTARAIRNALDTDMRTRGSTWPDRIERPGAFLATRLRHLVWRPDGPPHSGGYAAASPEADHAKAPTPIMTAHQRARIEKARAEIRSILHRHRRPVPPSCRVSPS